MPQKLSNAEFASAIKQRVPQLRDVPDDELVRKVLQRRPDLITKLTSPPSAPKVDMKTTRPTDFSSRVIDRLSENAQGMKDLPGSVITDARQRYDARKGKEPDLLNAAHSDFEALYSKGVEPLAKGVYSLSTPGAIQRIAAREDPANITGDALMQFLPGGEEGARAFDARRAAKVDPTAAGPLRGALTRAKQTMDVVDAQAKDIPVNHAPAYEWAKKAMDLERRGFTIPKPIKDFVAWIDSQSRPGMEKTGTGAYVDRGGSLQPLTYQAARDFEQALGQKIPWDQDPSGKINGLMKKMRESIGNETAAALKPYGLDVPYLKSKADFTKAYGAEAKWGPFGYFGGKVAGYGAGAFTGHPLMAGYAGGQMGRSAAGSLVRSIVNAGEADLDVATRRPGGGPSPVESMRVATDRVNALKMQIDRQRAAGDAGVYNTVSQLQAAEEALTNATRAVWGEKYANSPQNLSSKGGGGANYTAEDLAALKKKIGVPDPSGSGVSMKMFITKADEAALRNLGYTDDIINKMKPEQAGQILNFKRPAIGYEKGEK